MRNSIKHILSICLILFAANLFAQEQARVMTYNLLKYPLYDASTRNGYFKIIVDDIKPDILVCQEVESSTGMESFLSNVMGDKFKAGKFINGYDTDNVIFYRDSLFTLVNVSSYTTDLRNIAKYELQHKITGHKFYLFSLHLKAGNESSDIDQRQAEAKVLRKRSDFLDDGSYFMVMGDFNIYNSSEPAFQTILEQSTRGYFVDPINKKGNWHSNSYFSEIHTQATRSTKIASQEFSASGGLDDRFDMILVSRTIMDNGGITYIPGTYQAAGNDGNHFNKSIKILPNGLVDDDVAEALYYASDHLPIYADFEFESSTDVADDILPNGFSLDQNYPNPFNPSTNISFSLQKGEYVKLIVYNMLGEEVALLFEGYSNPGKHTFTFDASKLSSGIYSYVLSTNKAQIARKCLYLK